MMTVYLLVGLGIFGLLAAFIAALGRI